MSSSTVLQPTPGTVSANITTVGERCRSAILSQPLEREALVGVPPPSLQLARIFDRRPLDAELLAGPLPRSCPEDTPRNDIPLYGCPMRETRH